MRKSYRATVQSAEIISLISDSWRKPTVGACSACPKLHIAVIFVKITEIFCTTGSILGLLGPQLDVLYYYIPLRPAETKNNVFSNCLNWLHDTSGWRPVEDCSWFVVYRVRATGTWSSRIAYRQSLWLADMWHATWLQATGVELQPSRCQQSKSRRRSNN